MSQSIANAQAAVIFAADQPSQMERLSNCGSPAIRRAAERMAEIAEMHRRNDYNPSMERQIANDVIFYLSLKEIQRLCKAYDLR